MTSRILEECLDLEKTEEGLYSKYLAINIDDVMAIVVDPYVLNIQDFKNIRSNTTTLIRVRRPFWGQGNLHKYYSVIRREVC